MAITLSPKRPFIVPIEAECITPDAFAEKSIEKIASMNVWEGNESRGLGELFDVGGKANAKPEEMTIQILGDVGKIRRIGAGMSAGKIIINGDVGMHLGEEMKGGDIVVTGNAGSWTGCMMSDGKIVIKGDAGDYVGATYRGASTRGMEGGTIIIHGSAGNEVGCFMRNGLVMIFGNVGQFTGVHMSGGTIFVQKKSEERAGAQMVGGKIVISGHIPSVLPSFTIDGMRPSVKVGKEKVMGPFYRFIGDVAEAGNGKLYVSKAENTHLRFYESKIV